MLAIGYIAWILCCLSALYFTWGCRRFVAAGRTFSWAMAFQTSFLWWLTIGAVWAIPERRWHVLWMAPALFYLGRYLGGIRDLAVVGLLRLVAGGWMFLLLFGAKPRSN